MKLDYEILTNKKTIVTDLINLFRNEEVIAYDSETDGLDYMTVLLGTSFYFPKKRKAVFIPDDYYFSKGIPLDIYRPTLNKLLAKVKGIGHNVKYDEGVFEQNGIVYPELFADTSLMCHAWNPDNLKNLEIRVKIDLKIDKQKFEEIIGKKWNRIDWSKEADGYLDILGEYACEDVYCTYLLHDFYDDKISEDKGLTRVVSGIEYPLVETLKDMYMRGVTINSNVLYEMGVTVSGELERLMNLIYKESGTVFNVNSGKQMAEVLFDKLGYPSLKTTKGGARSTDSDTLESLALQGYKVCEYLVEYSTLQKLDSGYIKSIPKLLSDADGKLRCNFNSDGTRTGRMSSNNPNLQNQPNNKKFPIRKAFIASPGKKLLIADYSQIELRVMAHVSKDPRFMAAFLNGEDIHGAVASDLGIERRHAKIVNFGVLYGMGIKKLAHSLGIKDREAKKIIQNYERTYEGYYDWKTRTENYARKNREVRNIFGRVRRLPNVSSGNDSLLYGALRQAVNTVIQGSAADIIKIAMNNLHKRWKYEHPEFGAHILLQVHDELICEADIAYAQEAYDMMIHEMSNAVKLRVPLEVDGKICDNWSQMKDDNYKSTLITNSNENDLLWLL